MVMNKLVEENQQLQTGQIMVFTIEDRFVPYVRMTQRSKWVNRQAQRYLNSQAYLRCQFSQQMQASGYTMIPPRTPFLVQIETEMPSRLHCQDLDNQEKALIDAAQSVVFTDDRWLDAKTSIRRIGPHYKVTIWFQIMDENNW